MAIFTCVNHPNLRWSCKDLAVTNGKYNGYRNIFFSGVPDGTGMHSDLSGLSCTEIVNGEIVQECSCPPSDLILAPEDKDVRPMVRDANGHWIPGDCRHPKGGIA